MSTTTRKTKVLIYCQYVRGIGHLSRMIAIANVLNKNHEVLLVTGGEFPEFFSHLYGIHISKLSPIISYENGDQLLLRPVDDSISLQECQSIRIVELITCIDAFSPDLVIVEHFPFGDLFSFELIPALNHIRETPKHKHVFLVCSVRDIILTPGGNVDKDSITCLRLNTIFDALLVHSDPQIVTLEQSFSGMSLINIPVYYTGYVVREDPSLHITNKFLEEYISWFQHIRSPYLLCCIGGGRVGFELITAMSQCAKLMSGELDVVAVSGPFANRDEVKLFTKNTANISNFHFIASLPYLSPLMKKATACLSMCGYNTMVEVLASTTKSLLHVRPFHYGDEEQTLRAQIFEQRSLSKIVSRGHIEPEDIASVILREICAAPSQYQSVKLDGAACTAKLIHDFLMAT